MGTCLPGYLTEGTRPDAAARHPSIKISAAFSGEKISRSSRSSRRFPVQHALEPLIQGFPGSMNMGCPPVSCMRVKR